MVSISVCIPTCISFCSDTVTSMRALIHSSDIGRNASAVPGRLSGGRGEVF